MSDIFLKNTANSFIINVYTIGYDSKGESIYISIESNDKEFFYDILIDCYKTNKNRTMELLSKLKNEDRIDCICLTHYHDDHFTGLNEILDKYSKKNTLVLVPDVDCEESLSEEAVNIRNRVAEIVKNGRINYGTVQKISEPKSIVNDNLIIDNKKTEFGILAISPLSKITMRNIGRKPEDIEQNDYSISLLLTVDNLKFLFTGDIMNNTLININERYNINYLKIPHHGSKDSDRILEKISMDNDTVCVATNYKTSNLPDIELLNKYKHLTDEIYVFQKGTKDEFGIVHTKYSLNINNGNLIYDTENLYNSSKYVREQVWNI